MNPKELSPHKSSPPGKEGAKERGSAGTGFILISQAERSAPAGSDWEFYVGPIQWFWYIPDRILRVPCHWTHLIS